MAKWRKFSPNPAAVAPLLAEAFGDIGSGELPASCFGYKDRVGVIRRMTATYPNGWTITISFNAKGRYTSSSAKLKFAAKIKARTNG